MLFRGKEIMLYLNQRISMKYKVSILLFSVFALSTSLQAQVQRIKTFAGKGTAGFSGDGWSAPEAELSGPFGVAVDVAGNVYIQDYYNSRVRKVNTSNVITTIAGTGVQGNTGDGTLGSTAKISPSGVAVDKAGNVYIADALASVVRKVNTLGIISTVAGTGTWGYSGDGGAATAAKLRQPYHIAVDGRGNLFIAEAGNHVIRKVDSLGKISTYAGTAGVRGYGGDGGPATAATLDSPFAVAADRYGNVYVNDFGNNVIRKISSTRDITTYAGTGTYGYAGDGGLALFADFNAPKGIAVDTFGSVYVADALNNVVRKIDTFGMVSTVVGNGTVGFGGDLGPVNGANLHNPYAVAVDLRGNIYVADANNQRVRKTYSPVSVNTVTMGGTMQVYPNPVASTLNVAGLAKNDKVGVCDIAGRMVSELWTVNIEGVNTFSVGHLAAGVYMLQAWDAEGNKKQSVMITKN